MDDLSQLNQYLNNVQKVSYASIAMSCVVTIMALIFSISIYQQWKSYQMHMPIVVVPGAVGGSYTSGIYTETIKATSRYLIGLATNFSGRAGFEVRFDELESFSSPIYTNKLHQQRINLLHDIENQNQSRVFIEDPKTEEFKEVGNNCFQFRVSGERFIYASGLLLNSWKSTVMIKLHLGATDQHNRTGIQLDSILVEDFPTDRK